MDKNKLQNLQNILDEMTSRNFTAGVNCLVLQDGIEQCYFQSGYQDIENNKPMSRDTIFRLYSMSKTVTCVATHILIDRGQLDLFDDVSKYLPGFKSPTIVDENQNIVGASRQVRIHDLLDMTSGLSYPGVNNESEVAAGKLMDEIIERMDTDSPLSTVDIANRAGSLPLAFNPGSHFRYGFSADILGAVIEVVSGQKYSDFLKENIFIPLGMNNTDFWVPQDKQHRLAKVYNNHTGESVLYTYPNLGVSNHMLTPPAFESGGAGLCAGIDDFVPFTKMLMNNGEYNGKRILSEAAVKFISTHRLPDSFNSDIYGNMPHLSGYSYSNLMRVMTDAENAYSYGENGEFGWDGWLGTYMAIDPVNKLTILIMMQRVDAGTTEYTRRIRNLIYGSL